MSLAIFVSAYSGALRDQIRNFLVDNTAGAVASQTIPDLWLMFLAERGYTSGTLDDRLRQYLLAYTGASAGTTDDLWALITEPFSEGSDLLDLYPDAVVAYSSARRLRSAYSGPLIRVRRSSDSTEQDIGFDSETGLIDQSSLTTFVGANSGFVVTMYNQAEGGGFNATIATASLQPAIVVSGVVQTFGTNSRPAPLWDGTDDRLSAANIVIPGTQGVAYWAARDTLHTLYRAICHYGTAGVSSGEFAIYSTDQDLGANSVHLFLGSASGTSVASGAAPFSCVGRARMSLAAGATVENPRVNGGTESVGTATSGSWGTAKNLHLGNRSEGTSAYAGLLGEFIIYPSLSVATTSGVDDNMMTFWGIS
jgi:hypothetical protein